MSVGAEQGAIMAGAPSQAAIAGAQAVTAGKSSKGIADAVVSAGGTPSQGAAAAASAAAIGAGGGSVSGRAAGQSAANGDSPAFAAQAAANYAPASARAAVKSAVSNAVTEVGHSAQAESSSGNAGSGTNSGIAGAGSKMEENLGKLVDHLSQQGGPRTPTMGDHLKELNQHIAQEKVATHVSINANHQD